MNASWGFRLARMHMQKLTHLLGAASKDRTTARGVPGSTVERLLEHCRVLGLAREVIITVGGLVSIGVSAYWAGLISRQLGA